MRKIRILLLLCAALLCACSAAPQAAPASPAPTADAAPAAQENPAPPDPSAQEALSALLGELRENVTIATAGSSLRAAAMTAKLLDWAEDTKVTDEQIRAALEPWLQPPDDGVPADFREQLQAVESMFHLLTDDPGKEAEGLLSDAGCEDCGYPWSAEAVATVGRILTLAADEG